MDSRLDLNLFRVLNTIYREGNLTRAAERLNLTQPAVSHSLNRLRQLYGDPLFIRQGSQMMPTALTRQIIDEVQRGLACLQASVRDLEPFDPTSSRRHFTLSLPDFLESQILSGLMEESVSSDVSFTSMGLDRSSMVKQLSRGDVDLALDIFINVPGEVHKQALTAQSLKVLTEQNHPRIQNKLDEKSYLQERHVLVSSRRDGPGREDIELGRRDLRRRIQLRCQHVASALSVVSRTDLLLTLPTSVAHIAAEGGGYLVFPFPFSAPTIEVFMYWHRELDEDEGHRWLRGKISGLVKGD